MRLYPVLRPTYCAVLCCRAAHRDRTACAAWALGGAGPSSNPGLLQTHAGLHRSAPCRRLFILGILFCLYIGHIFILGMGILGVGPTVSGYGSPWCLLLSMGPTGSPKSLIMKRLPEHYYILLVLLYSIHFIY